MPNPHHQRDGLISAIAAYGLWGFMPIYFKVLDFVNGWEMLAHRIVWAVPFGMVIIHLRGQWGQVHDALRSQSTLIPLLFAALLIGANWMVYIYAVQSDQILQASLGYYINPLLSVLAGVLVFSEKLRPKQIFALVLAAAGVAVMTVSRGGLPLIAISLAASFTIYGVIRKRVAVGAMPGLFVETLVLLPAALLFGMWLLASDRATFSGDDLPMAGALMLAGPFSVLPLLFFAIGARRLPLSTMGFLQFVGPTLTFLVGVYYGEKLTAGIVAAFVLIWTAVATFAFDAWHSRRRMAMSERMPT